MFFDLVIISFNTRNLVYECIQSALATGESLINNIFVVDNNSSDDTVDFIKKSFPFVTIIENDDNLGYSKAVNIGVAECNSPYILISNSDIQFLPNAIAKLAELLNNSPEVSVAGVRQVYPNHSWQYSFGGFPNRLNGLKDAFFITLLTTAIRKFKFNHLSHDSKAQEVEYADGGMLAVRKSTFDAVDGFDEDYFFYSEDMDFCYKIWQFGGKVVFSPKAKVIHLRGASSALKFVNYDSLSAILYSKVKFAKKHLPRRQFLSYSQSQVAKDKILVLVYSILSLFAKKFYIKKDYHQNSFLIWKKIVGELKK